MYEKHNDSLATRKVFLSRVARSFLIAITAVLVVLTIGIAGYHYLAHLPWLVAFLNASMILATMGPVSPMDSAAAMLFSGFYALFCGLAFLTIFSILIAPFLHRFLHYFHSRD